MQTNGGYNQVFEKKKTAFNMETKFVAQLMELYGCYN